MYFCSVCNKKIERKDLICPDCGSHLFYQTENVMPLSATNTDEVAVTPNAVTQPVSEISAPSTNDEVTEEYTVYPRFVFVYELLPSSLGTLWLLILIFIVSNLIREYFHLRPNIIVILFAGLLLYKDLKIFYRKFRYRNVSYIISNKGIRYKRTGSNAIDYFIPYANVTDVFIRRNLATVLFGYGHILVKEVGNGIYLDYVANVDKVYDYIVDHVRK